MDILVTCFEPFGADSANSSQLAVDLLPDTIDGHAIHKATLPVSFDRCSGAISQAIGQCKPDMVIMTGQARRDAVCLERLAINWAISQKADNDGRIAGGERIQPDGPDAIFTTFPVDAIAASIARQTGLPIKASNTAGTFVCNRLYYDVLSRRPAIPALFIHLPLTPSQAVTRATAPSLPPQTAATILRHLIAQLPVSAS